MKVSARTREAAAILCSMAASNPIPAWFDSTSALDITVRAAYLAALAVDFVWRNATRKPHHSVQQATAEAESLLRTGWTP